MCSFSCVLTCFLMAKYCYDYGRFSEACFSRKGIQIPLVLGSCVVQVSTV